MTKIIRYTRESEAGMLDRYRQVEFLPAKLPPKLGAEKSGKPPEWSACVSRLNAEIKRRRPWWRKLTDALFRLGEH